MCGIVGGLDKLSANAPALIRPMLETIRHRGPDGYGVSVGNLTQKKRTLEELDFSSHRSERAVGHARLAIVGGTSGTQPLEGCKEGLVVFHNGEIYNHKILRAELESTHKFETLSDSEIIVHLLEDFYDGNLREALIKTLKRLDGVFALAALDDNDLIIARDVMGVKQLYVTDNSFFAAFASERKALWSIGVKNNGERLPPGHIAMLSKRGLELHRFQEPPIAARKNNIITETEEAIKEYTTALRTAVSKRVQDLDNIGVIFSGGVDSVLLAKLIKDEGVNFTCYCAGTEDSSDLRHAEFAASKLGFKLRANKLDADKIEHYLPKAMGAIEDRSFGQVEVAVPVYAAVELACEDGVRVMLTGQAADELFAGYSWYRVIANKEGYDKLTFRLADDLLQLYKETLEREDKITMVHSIELRVPYLDPDVVRVAMSIAAELKLPPKQTIDKYIHRQAALRLGVPKELALRVKQAAQHGSGVHELIEELALQLGFNHALVDSTGYSAEKNGPEALGSCWRYGYQYLPEEKLRTPDNIQLYLDTIAYEHKLTSQEDWLLLDALFHK